MKQYILLIAFAAMVGCSGDKSPTSSPDTADYTEELSSSSIPETTSASEDSTYMTQAPGKKAPKSSSSKAKSSSSREPEADTGASEADTSASEPEGDTRSSSSSKEAKGSPSDAKGSSGKVTASSSSKEVESSSDTGEPEYCRRAKDILITSYPANRSIWADAWLSMDEKIEQNGGHPFSCDKDIFLYNSSTATEYCIDKSKYPNDIEMYASANEYHIYGDFFKDALELSRTLFEAILEDSLDIENTEDCSNFTTLSDVSAKEFSIPVPYCNDTLTIIMPVNMRPDAIRNCVMSYETPGNSNADNCHLATTNCYLDTFSEWRNRHTDSMK